jgi:hypothetical protein
MIFKNSIKQKLQLFALKKISYKEIPTKCTMIDKKFINRDTFIAKYKINNDPVYNLPIGMHVSVM